MSENSLHVDVVVLGAGVAGLAAAARLVSKVSVLVLEGRNRIGGRVHSVDIRDNQRTRLRLDLGAQWIHGDDATENPIAELAFLKGIDTITTCPLKNTLYSCTGAAISQQQHDQWKQLYDEQFAQFLADQQEGNCLGPFETVADMLEAFIRIHQRLNEDQRIALEYLINTRIEQEYGAQAADLSALYFDHDEDCNGNQAMFPKGYSQVVTALAAPIQQHILLQHHVNLIRYSPEGVSVEVTTPNGVKTFTAQYAIATFPLGVLKKHISTLFEPPLPASKTAAIQQLGVGLLNKVALLYEEAFWAPTAWLNRLPTPGNHWQNRWQEVFNVAKYIPELPMLVAFTAADPAWEAEQDTDEVLIQQVTSVLADMYPEHAAAAMSPKQTWITRWGSDLYALGSFSYMAKGSTPADVAALAAPVEDTLFFAGEAMSGRNQGTAHGAYNTGVDAAAAILEQLRYKSSSACSNATNSIQLSPARSAGQLDGVATSMVEPEGCCLLQAPCSADKGVATFTAFSKEDHALVESP